MRPDRDQSREEIIVAEHLSDLRGRVRLLTWVSGLSWTVLVLFGGLLVTGVLDWLIHFDDPGLRLVIGLALLAGSGAMLWRQLISPLMQPLGTTFLASRIERRFPGLHSRVLSAVEFLQHKLDAKSGSPELQRAVVGQALRDLETIEPGDIVETKAVHRVTLAGSILLAVVATVVALHPLEAATSVQRLMFPFADVPWPRQFELRLVRSDLSPVVTTPDQPLLIARGDTLELYVINARGRLPERVWFEHRLGNEAEATREALRQTTIRDEKGRSREAAAISWVAARGPLEFRATGGDDDAMPFVRVEVVEPPTLEALQVGITPPKYSGRPAEQLPPGVGHVQGLLGTKIELTGQANKPLQSAVLRIGDKPSVPLSIGPDGQSFAASFAIIEPGVTAYWFELTDTAGFTDREAPRYELRGLADLVPEVVIESPVADIQLAPDAELTVTVLAKDDLGLREVRLVYQLNDEAAPKSIPLVAVENGASDPDAPKRPGHSKRTVESPSLLLTPEYLWKLAELELQPGGRIVFRAEATDDYDLTPEGHVGRSSPRTILIVSKEDKQKELAGRVGELLEDLQEAAALQLRAKQQTNELQTQLDTAGELRPQDIDQLQRIELDQRQAASRLTHPSDGVQSQARQLQEEFQANKLDDVETQRRLDRVVEELSRLGRDQFPEIERALTRAAKEADSERGTRSGERGAEGKNEPVKSEPDGKAASNDKSQKNTKPENTKPTAEPKSSEGDKPADPKPTTEPGNSALRDPRSALASSLKDAQTRQQQTSETLQELQDLLAEWRDRRDVSRELQSVIAEQEQVQKESADLGQQTLTKSAAELSQQEKADLGKLAAKQRKLAEQVEQFRKQLDQTAGSLKPRDPDVAERFEEARDELTNDGTAGKLREAASDIADNKMGAAAQAQQQAMQDLRDLERQLKREPTDDVELLVKQVEQAQQEFETLRKEQTDLMEQTQQAAGRPDSAERRDQLEQLRQKQQKLGKKLAQAERKLERLQLRQPADAAARAQERLDKINDQLQDPDQADEAADGMQEVVDDIEQVERDLALEKRIAQERLAVEQLEKIEDELKGLLARQQAVITETERLEAERLAKGSLSRGQLKSLRDLAETERALQTEAERMEKALTVAEVFSLVLRRTSRSIKLASDRLAEKQTDASTQALERDAAKKIESLLAVLKQDDKPDPANASPPMPPEQQPDDEQPKPEQAGPPGDSLPQIAQLKMIKLLQEEYLERTQLLNGLRVKEGNLSPSAATELEQLAVEQDELAELTRNLVVKLLQSRSEQEDASKPADDGGNDNVKPNSKQPEDSPDKALDLDKPFDLKKHLDDETPRKGKRE